MKKRIILFDIDRTIFDTDKMSKMFNDLMLQILDYPNKLKFQKVKDEYTKNLKRDRDFVPEDSCKNLANKFNINKYQDLIDVFFASQYSYIYKISVYKETLEVLEKLKPRYKLGIYSEGTLKFQTHKFKSMGISDYFEPNLVFIVDAKDTQAVLDKIPKEVVIVDDKETICEYLTKNGFRAIWLNKKNNRKSKNFETIHSLLELPAII